MSVLHVSGLQKLIQCKNNDPFFSCWALFLWGRFPVSGSPSSCTNRSVNTAAGSTTDQEQLRATSGTSAEELNPCTGLPQFTRPLTPLTKAPSSRMISTLLARNLGSKACNNKLKTQHFQSLCYSKTSGRQLLPTQWESPWPALPGAGRNWGQPTRNFCGV